MQTSLFLILTDNQSQNYLINFNCLANQNSFKLFMCGWFYLNKMHADRANLIMRYLSIQRSDLEIGTPSQSLESEDHFLRYAMNELMHVMQS